jgi:hypothetical protein
MKNWMALAANFLATGIKDSEGFEVSELPTKLTEPPPADVQTPSEDVAAHKFEPQKLPTKLTKPSSRGVVSVLSVPYGQDEFDDRVVCTDCKNFRYGHCEQHLLAGIGNSSKVAINLVSLPQRCPAFRAKR